MNLFRPYKGKNWREIVRTLKEGPDFGIHITDFWKMKKIIRDVDSNRTGYARGHYFAVRGREKSWSDNYFYGSLWSSIDTASEFSFSYTPNDEVGQVSFTENPSLLLGIEENESGFLTTYFGNGNHPFWSRYGFNTFPIGHDFILKPGVLRLEGVTLGDKELDRISQRVIEYTERMKKNSLPLGMNISRSLLVKREVTRGLIKKVKEKIEEKIK